MNLQKRLAERTGRRSGMQNVGEMLAAAGLNAQDFPVEPSRGNGLDPLPVVAVAAEPDDDEPPVTTTEPAPKASTPSATRKATKVAAKPKVVAKEAKPAKPAGDIFGRARAVLSRTSSSDGALGQLEDLESALAFREGQRQHYASLGTTKAEREAFDATPEMQEVEEFRAAIAALKRNPSVLIASKVRENRRAAAVDVERQLAKQPLLPNVISTALERALSGGLVAQGMSGAAPFNWSGRVFGPASEERVCVDTALAFGNAVDRLEAEQKREEERVLAYLKKTGLFIGGKDMDAATKEAETGTLHQLVDGVKTQHIMYVEEGGYKYRLLVLWKDGMRGAIAACTFPAAAKRIFAFRRKGGALDFGPLPFEFTGERGERFTSENHDIAKRLNDAWRREEAALKPKHDAKAEVRTLVDGANPCHVEGWKASPTEIVALDYNVEFDESQKRVRVTGCSEVTTATASWLADYSDWVYVAQAMRDKRFFWCFCHGEVLASITAEPVADTTDSKTE